MSNALGRLFGTIGSGVLYTYVGKYVGDKAGSDGTAGMAACFLAGTLSSLVAALITFKIEDDETGLKCGSCCTIVSSRDVEDEDEEENEVEDEDEEESEEED